MPSSFLEKLNTRVQRTQSLLCLGLDPELEKIPADFLPSAGLTERLSQWCLHLVSLTDRSICCVKPNIAFYEQYGAEGLAALKLVLAGLPADLPVLLDAKRGDIGSTAAAYARACFEVWGADAVTLSPYLGRDSVAPFLKYPGKMVFVLCQTSNPSAGELQDLGQPPLYVKVAEKINEWGTPEQIGLVVGATRPESLAEVRQAAPQNWILAPGVGAQGGDLVASLEAGLRPDGLGVLIPVSRGVMQSPDPAKAAHELSGLIQQIRSSHAKDRTPDASETLILALHAADCVRFGNFTLASGKQSPIYIDLRRVISYPHLFRQVVAAYSRLVNGLTYDRLAAVPYAALPAAAGTAMALQKALIYPRKEAKTHGTGQLIEGAFEAGQKALVIEDVITTGGSILTAISTLREAGLVVEDVVVLVDRLQGGREALAGERLELHAVLTIDHIVDVLHQKGRLTHAQYTEVTTYLKENHA